MKEIGRVKAHDESVWGVSIHDTLPLLCTCSSDKTAKIFKIVDKEEGKVELVEIAKLDDNTHSKTIRSVKFKPSTVAEYPTVALGSFDSTCSIWGADTMNREWELLAVIEGHENEIKCVDWSFDGRYLGTVARDKSVWIWETDELNEEFECVCVLNEHEGDVKCLSFSRFNNVAQQNSYALVTCGYDDSLRVWKRDAYNEDEWVCAAVLRLGCTVWCCCWIDATTIAAGLDNGQVVQYKLAGGAANAASAAADETPLPSSVVDTEEWVLCDEQASHEGAVYSIGVAASGASGAGKSIVSAGRDGSVVLAKVGSAPSAGPGAGPQNERIPWALHGREVLAVCPLGELVAVAGDSGEVVLYRL